MKLLLIGMFCLCLAAPVMAQDKGSAAKQYETYTGEDFTLQYPQDWTIDSELDNVRSVLFQIPIPGEASIGEGMMMSRDDMTALITLEPGGAESALEFAQDEVSAFLDDSDVFNPGMALAFTVGERDAAFADVLGMLSLRFVVMTAAEDAKLMVMLSGVPPQFTEVMPQLLDVLNTVRLPGDESPIEAVVVDYLLPQSHARANQWRLDYPAGWTVEEQNAYSLLAIPNSETTIGISVIQDSDADDLDGWADAVLDNLLRNVPNGEHSIERLILLGRPALRLDFLIPGQDSAFGQWFRHADDEVLANLTVIGTAQDIAVLRPLLDQLVVTVAAA